MLQHPTSSTNQLLELGLIAMSASPDHDLTMMEVVKRIVSTSTAASNQMLLLDESITGIPHLQRLQDSGVTLKMLASYLESVPHNHHTGVYIGLGAVLTVIATVCIVLRLYTRCWIVRDFSRADLAMLGAWLSTAAYMFVQIVDSTTKKGQVCHRVWDMSYNQWIFGYTLLSTFVSSLLFLVANFLVKLSYLFFYWDLAPTVLWFRRAVLVIGGFVTLTAVATLGVILFSCMPINIWDHPFAARCTDSHALAAMLSLLLVGDFLVLLMPVALVFISMQLGTQKKIGLTAMFAVGMIACIAAIVRLYYVVAVGNLLLADAPRMTCAAGFWSQLELCLAIIISCLPSLRLFIRYLFQGRSGGHGDVERASGVKLGPIADSDGHIGKSGLSSRSVSDGDAKLTHNGSKSAISVLSHYRSNETLMKDTRVENQPVSIRVVPSQELLC